MPSIQIEYNIVAGETQSCSMCRPQPPPCRQPQSATSPAQPRQRRQPVGGGRGEPFLPTPWTAQTLEWSPAP